MKSTMSANDDIRRLESELEDEKQDLRRDVSRIDRKVKKTRAELSPTNFIREHVLLLTGLALILGFALGYREVRVEEFSTPVARAMLTTAGKQATLRVFGH